jgi:hypothetical protein
MPDKEANTIKKAWLSIDMTTHHKKTLLKVIILGDSGYLIATMLLLLC